jgi:hypothetical protein
LIPKWTRLSDQMHKWKMFDFIMRDALSFFPSLALRQLMAFRPIDLLSFAKWPLCEVAMADRWKKRERERERESEREREKKRERVG